MLAVGAAPASHDLQALRLQRAMQAPSQIKELTVKTVKAEIGGQVVLEARDISLSVSVADQIRLLVKHFNLKIQRGDRLVCHPAVFSD